MRKLLLTLSLIVAICIGFTSCEATSDKSATANVKVTKNGVAQVGTTVYMFNSSSGPSTSFYKPSFAKKQAITENGGVATFILQETFDLEIIAEQTTLYFAVFEGEKALGETALTIKKGETKTVNINL